MWLLSANSSVGMNYVLGKGGGHQYLQCGCIKGMFLNFSHSVPSSFCERSKQEFWLAWDPRCSLWRFLHRALKGISRHLLTVAYKPEMIHNEVRGFNISVSFPCLHGIPALVRLHPSLSRRTLSPSLLLGPPLVHILTQYIHSQRPW